MTACKHANGRDYWVVMGGSLVNTFYEFLVTPDSIFGPYNQTIGPDFPGPFDNAYSKFSQDGTKYATCVEQGPVLVLDFDRCSGQFSNPIIIYNKRSYDTSANPPSGGTGIEFSPNGRFLYVSDIDNMNQYDLWFGNVQDSVQIYYADSNDASLLNKLQLGPNGKLYGSTWNGGFYFYHVVNNPNAKGDSCDFVWGGQITYSLNSVSVSNLINYKLGPLVGSGCDTIADIGHQTIDIRLLRIMPNPADKYIYVEMGTQGNYEFDLLNSVGQVVDIKETRQVDIFDTEGLANGVYVLRVIDRDNADRIFTQKVVVGH
jgi:hypothetical protein